MKRLLLIIPILLMLVSCKFTGGRQQSSDSGVAETILEKVGSALESLEQAEDQARAEADHARYQEKEEEVFEEQAEPEPDPWYNHDFSLVYVQHKYATPSRPAPDLDETYSITRVDDKVYLQYTLRGVIQKTSVYEATAEGYNETIYKGGKVDWEHAFDNQSLNSEIRYLLRKKYPVAVDLPEGVDLRKAKEDTFLGRPCLIAELYEEEAGGKATTTYYIDKEYGFFYRATQVGTNGNGQEINMTPFEVTYFTDKPTAQNIPNPKASNNPVDALKKQLQGQLDSAQK